MILDLGVRAETVARLNAGSTLVDTAAGPVEFARQRPAGADADTPVVVMFHGTPQGHQASFYAVPIVEAGFDVITPSRPGYLRTPLSTGRTFEEQADAIAALLDELGIERASAYGVSGGGPSSILFATRYPERSSALILEVAISQRFEPDVPDWLVTLTGSAFFHWLNAQLMRWLPRFAINQLVSFESTLTPAERRRTADRILADPARRAFLAQLLESASLTPLQREGFHNDLRQFRDIGVLPLSEVQCPTLVVHGTHDRDVPFAHAEHSAREIPQA